MLLYGALVEAERLVVRRRVLRLNGWPEGLNGYRIALLADFHLRDQYTVALARRACEAAVAEKPDVIVIAGDFVGYWKNESPWLLGEALEPLIGQKVIAVPGNHDYWSGTPELLQPICEELGIGLLRNEGIELDGIQWVGIDSFNAREADPLAALCSAPKPLTANCQPPTIAMWHEPDAVRHLPEGCHLMLSGHSHGGQFVFPGGWAPMSTKNGKRYVRGFYPSAPTPLYVTTGVGTTGPPSRFLCPPEVVVLELIRE